MFRRSSSASDSPVTEPVVEETLSLAKGESPKKGKATPTRAEAQEAAKLRAKPPRTRKEQAAARRKAVNEGRPIMARDEGPVRKFVRDYVDVRFSFLEILMPVMVVVLIFSLVAGNNATLSSIVSMAMLFSLFLAIIDGVFLKLKLKRELVERFGADKAKGNTWYAVSRAMQIRPLRLPKPQKKIGAALDADYR